jgi:hypothetical protein
MPARDFTTMSLEELASVIKNCEPGSIRHGEVLAEYSRHQTDSQINAGHAQGRAALAAEETARYTK